MADAEGVPTGLVSSIFRCSHVDGPGIRTTVFFKGCMLRCLWCHNPETQSDKLEVMFEDQLCMDGCSECVKVCSEDAIISKEDGRINRDNCTACMKCVEACPTNAIQQVGTKYTGEQLADTLLKDKIVMQNSQGGVTFSGGEPLVQDLRFLADLAKRLREEGIHIALDTCGATQWKVYEEVKEWVDLFLYDIKHTDNPEYRTKLVLENAMKLAESGAKMWIRIPLIPQFNATDAEVAHMGEFIKSLKAIAGPNLQRLNLLPFHRLPEQKYFNLGRGWKLQELKEVSEEIVQHFKEVLEEASGMPVIIGG